MEIREVDDVEGLRAIERLFCAVWRTPPNEPPIGVGIMKALAHSGSYVAGAFDDGRLIGASVGFLGGGDQEPHLHSHITGVVPEAQGRQVGYALKRHQRDWCLARGIGVAVWTFDPLIRRNAWFNLHRLGAAIVGFEPDFYGDMPDGVNSGDPSDRCLVRWDLAAAGPRPAADAEGTAVVLAEDADGAPVVTASDAPARRCFVPADVVALRAERRPLAAAWRHAFRDAFGQAMDDGLVVTGMTRDGSFVLRAREPEVEVMPVGNRPL